MESRKPNQAQLRKGRRPTLLALIGLFLLSGWVGVLGIAQGQDTGPEGLETEVPEGTEAEVTLDEKNVTAIRSLLTSISVIEKEIELLRGQMASAASVEEREGLAKELEEKILQLERLSGDLEVVATGIDIREYEEEIGLAADLSSEFEEFMRPLVGQLKDLTAKPREMEGLRARASHHGNQIELAQKALAHIDLLLETAGDETIVDTLRTLRILWVKRLETAESDLAVAEVKLEEAEKRKSSVFVSARESIANFFRTRGRNLLTSLVAFLVVWLGIRFAYRLVIRFAPIRRKKGRNFYIRLADVVVEAVALFAGIFAAVLVLYVASDWVLLALLMLFLFGMAWAGKRALPLMYEQTKLLLNLGSVREGERVVVDGIPWIVKRISVYTDLVNPKLLGGKLRVPMSKLMTLHSRPYESKESWFPTDVGDWLELSDGTFGKIIRQTPHWITVVELGGARKGFKLMEFLSLSPRILSPHFRVATIFGIDYQHQAISTTEVPAILRERLEHDLIKLIEPEELIHVDVLFKEAGASSLDYAILADFAGSAAPRNNRLKCEMQRICVNVCNEQGWVIPFTQITLHQAPVREPLEAG